MKKNIKKLFDLTVLSDADSWINNSIPTMLCQLAQEGHKTRWVHHPKDIEVGDFVFCLGCSQLISARIRARNRHTLIVHESALPEGRGWSPLTWQILEGKQMIPITLLEAEEEVDSGNIYLQKTLEFDGTELVDELRAIQEKASIDLCLEFVENYPNVLKKRQSQKGNPSHYSRRRPTDSQLDPDKTIREQFNLFRVVDNIRYPAFFHLKGETYCLKVEKLSQVNDNEEMP